MRGHREYKVFIDNNRMSIFSYEYHNNSVMLTLNVTTLGTFSDTPDNIGLASIRGKENRWAPERAFVFR
jgi:hypothetical protein